MEKQYKAETVDSKFMAGLRKKYDTKQKDETKIAEHVMENILGDIVQVPEKLHMTGSPDKSSVKEQKSGENQLHTGTGENRHKSTMGKEY